MRSAISLGARLFWSTPEQRRRSLLVIAATAVGEIAMLTVFAIAAASLSTPAGQSNAPADRLRLLLAIVLAISLPVLTLAASVARFSASLRDRRLANLRLLGLPSTSTRVVAAVEIGLGAVIGTLTGALVFAVVRAPLAEISLPGWAWSPDAFMPDPAGWLLAAVAVPLTAVVAAAMPKRLDAAAALVTARKADTRRPGWWRVVPLAVGLGTCLVIGSRDNVSYTVGTVLMGAITLTGIGVLLVVPVFVRLLADALVRFSRTPSLLIAARRMQAQPAGVSRLVAALMVGLFVVSGARMVLVAFESTSNYAAAELSLRVGQFGTVDAPAGKASKILDEIESLPVVRAAAGFASIQGSYKVGKEDWGANVIVGRCADLARVAPGTTGCSDREAAWLNRYHDGSLPQTRIDLQVDGARQRHAIAAPTRVISLDQNYGLGQMYDIFVPAGLVPSGPLLDKAHRTIAVLGRPGRDLDDRLAGIGNWSTSAADFEMYDFVGGLRALLCAISIAVLSVGLLAFAVSGIDRALGRRRELASLQILGTPPAVLRRAQWWEAALPTGLGAALAIVAGWLAGLSYLSLAESRLALPWSSMIALGGGALVAAAMVAGLTVVATNVRLTPDLVRSE